MKKAAILLCSCLAFAMVGMVGKGDTDAMQGVNPSLEKVECQVDGVYHGIHGESTLCAIMPDGSIHVYVVDSGDVYNVERGDYVEFETSNVDDYTVYRLSEEN